jgi:hypothetical protein
MKPQKINFGGKKPHTEHAGRDRGALGRTRRDAADETTKNQLRREKTAHGARRAEIEARWGALEEMQCTGTACARSDQRRRSENAPRGAARAEKRAEKMRNCGT